MLFADSLLMALGASLLTALAILSTQNIHGHLTLDGHVGVQKLHKLPTPRIGGVALVAGALVGGFSLPSDAKDLWWPICLASLPTLIFGLAEDLTKRVSVKARLLATVCAGLLFSVMTGYRITEVDIPGLDLLFSFWLPSILFTAFAIGGVANAINIIDGVNGLASGTSIIILTGFAIVAAQTGDAGMLGVCLVAIGALCGFFLLNFPMGRLFLGDAGAYSTGFVLAAIAVALPQRNPELSPLIGLLALSYPVTETLVSIHRRLRRAGTHPGQADRLHLHSLVYRSRALRLAHLLRVPHWRNALTGLMMMGFPLGSAAGMIAFQSSSIGIVVCFALLFCAYLVLYRRVALLKALGVIRLFKTAA